MTDRHRIDDHRAAGLAVVVAAGAVLATIVAAVVRALVDDWYPVGDNAYFALRSLDVLTEDHPLLGTWTSASRSAGIDFNNPGPLLFDWYAPAAKVDPGFLPLAVGALVLACVAAMAWCGARVAGRRGVLVALFASGALAAALGPELLIDPWQPHALLFPFLALIGAVWAAVAGTDASLVVVAALASLLVQTHLSYAPPVAVLSAVAVGAVGVRALRDPARRPGIARVSLVVVVVVGLAWSQPVVEQFTADDRGNLDRLTTAATSDRGENVGPALATRVTGTLVSPLPAWAPPSFEDEFDQVQHRRALPPRFTQGPSTLVAAVSIGATLLALGAIGVLARRRGATALTAGAAVAVVSVATAWLTVASLPLTELGLPPHHVRLLWPVSIGVTTVGAAVLVTRRRGAVVVAGTTVLLALVAGLPTHPAEGPITDEDAAPVMRALAPQLESLVGTGPLLFDPTGIRIFEPYTTPVMLELEERGVEVVVDDPGFIRQLGPARAADGTENGRFFVWQGDLAVEGDPSLERVALVESLSESERDELDRLGDELTRLLQDGALQTTAIGRLAIADGLVADVEAAGDAPDPLAEVGLYDVEVALSRGFLVSEEHQATLDRWVELRTRFVRGTVAVWVEWSAGSDG